MFRSEFALHVHYRQGCARFQRTEELPFAPFIGLDVLDDAIGQFHLTYVAWHSGSQMFLCQAQVEMKDFSIRQVASRLKKAGWIEEKDAQQATGEWACLPPQSDLDVLRR